MKAALDARQIFLSAGLIAAATVWGVLMVVNWTWGVGLGIALLCGVVLLRNASLGWYLSLATLVLVANYFPPRLSAPLIWLTLLSFLGSYWLNRLNRGLAVRWYADGLWLGIVLWLVWTGITALTGLNAASSAKELARYLISFAVFLTYVNWFESIEQLRRRWYFLLAVVGTVGALAIFEFAVQMSTGAWNWSMLGKYPPTTSEMGSFFACVLPVAVALYFGDKRLPRWLHYLICGGLLFATYLSESRASFLAAVAGLLAVFYMVSSSWRKQVLVLFAVLGISTLGLMLWFVPGTDGFLLYNITGRERLWVAAFEVAKENPIFGIGPGCWHQWFGDTFMLADFVMDDQSGNTYIMPPDLLQGEAHQLFFTKLAEMGFPGFFGLIALFVLWGKFAVGQLRAFNKKTWGYFATLGSIGSMIGMTVLCLFENGPIIGRARGGEVLIVWFVAAIPLVARRLEKQAEDAKGGWTWRRSAATR